MSTKGMHWKLSKKTKEKMSKAQLGNKKGRGNRGSKSHFWKGGINSLNNTIRGLDKYSNWRSHIFGRDLYTCRECGIRGVYFEAHHIKPLSLILKENNIKTVEQAIICDNLWDLNNGITLCKKCHRKTDSYGNNNL